MFFLSSFSKFTIMLNYVYYTAKTVKFWKKKKGLDLTKCDQITDSEEAGHLL